MRGSNPEYQVFGPTTPPRCCQRRRLGTGKTAARSRPPISTPIGPAVVGNTGEPSSATRKTRLTGLLGSLSGAETYRRRVIGSTDNAELLVTKFILDPLKLLH